MWKLCLFPSHLFRRISFCSLIRPFKRRSDCHSKVETFTAMFHWARRFPSSVPLWGPLLAILLRFSCHCAELSRHYAVVDVGSCHCLTLSKICAVLLLASVSIIKRARFYTAMGRRWKKIGYQVNSWVFQMEGVDAQAVWLMIYMRCKVSEDRGKRVQVGIKSHQV